MISERRTIFTSDTIETLNKHVSIRRYTDEPVDDETVLTLMRAARRAPTSSNMQTYSLIAVRDLETRRKLKAFMVGNQDHVDTCQVFFAVCADISRVIRACELHGKALARTLEISMVATVDAALVGMSLATAAESIGLGTVMVGSIRNDPEEAARLLGLPEGVFVVFGLCVGWSAENPAQKPRMAEELIFHFERYRQDDLDDHLRDYDRQLAEYRRSIGQETPDTAWTSKMADRFPTPARPGMRAALEHLGFRFE
jgi:FMN reductase (NADPH)